MPANPPTPPTPSHPTRRGTRPHRSLPVGSGGTILLLAGFWILLALLAAEQRVGAGNPEGARPSPLERVVIPGATRSSEPLLAASAVCPDAGFLCAELERGEVAELRVARWPDDAGPLRVQVPAPAHEDPRRARALRDAAARGVGMWDGWPRPLRIERLPVGRRPDPGADVRVSWSDRLEGGKLGRVRSRWIGGRRGPSFQVEEFRLATGPRDRPLDTATVKTTAAHEMGHALGLRHSPDPDDLMYSRRTTDRLSPRDLETVEALYDLPNGGIIRPR